MTRDEKTQDAPREAGLKPYPFGSGVESAKARQAMAEDFATRGAPYTANCIRNLLDVIHLWDKGSRVIAQAETRRMAIMGGWDDGE